MKKWYFALFLPAREGGYSILFPDFPEIASQGDDIDDAMFMAQDALNIVAEEYVRSRDELPLPSTQEQAQAALDEEMKDPEGLLDTTRKPLLQLFAAPLTDTTPVKISATFTRRTLDIIDMKAKAHGMTRSGFLAAAAQAYS